MPMKLGYNFGGFATSLRLLCALAIFLLLLAYIELTRNNNDKEDFPTRQQSPSNDFVVIVKPPAAAIAVIDEQNSTNINNDCSDELRWPFHLELFLPVPPNENGLKELEQMILPSLGLFWPMQNLRLLFLTDGEAKDVGEFADQMKQAASEVFDEPAAARSRVVYNFPTARLTRGWDRQQWLMFWADNFTSADYVGFVDSDAVFVTRVTKSDLFTNDGRPIVRALYGKPYDPNWWAKVPKITFETMGRLEPFGCMSYFPVIIKIEHLKSIREHIRQHLNKTTFDEAFRQVASKYYYSQFNLMCAYLWYNKQDEYYWIIEEREPGWKGPFPEGQVRSLAEAGIDVKLLQRQLPHLAVHWNYEKFKNEPGAMKEVFKTGICYSTPDHDETRPKFCADIVNRTETFNAYEWAFEGYTFFSDRSKQAHLERLRRIDQCPHKWNLRLIANLTG